MGHRSSSKLQLESLTANAVHMSSSNVRLVGSFHTLRRQRQVRNHHSGFPSFQSEFTRTNIKMSSGDALNSMPGAAKAKNIVRYLFEFPFKHYIDVQGCRMQQIRKYSFTNPSKLGSIPPNLVAPTRPTRLVLGFQTDTDHSIWHTGFDLIRKWQGNSLDSITGCFRIHQPMNLEMLE